MTAQLFSRHEGLLKDAIRAMRERKYYTPYAESPKAYAEDGDAKGRSWISSVMNNDFSEIRQEGAKAWHGEEVSPFLQVGIGVRYPLFDTNILIERATTAQKSWGKTSPEERAGLLIESLEQIKGRFFDIAYATMHTTGQGYMMSFQASGPHANDRALEAVAMGYEEQTRFPHEVEWVKSMGKFDLKVNKDYRAVPKGPGLVVGCSTFPVWNTVPGLYATLMTGNTCIVKPHPKAILPIAIVIGEIQKVLEAAGMDVNIVQLAADSSASPITKQLAEHAEIRMIDFTGSSEFGNYIESLPKTTFTEKAGVNSVILDSVTDLKAVLGNLAFSTSLYSGQMCTAPQNIFVSSAGVKTPEGNVSFENVVQGLSAAVSALVDNPKAGPGTLGAIQAEATYTRVQEAGKHSGGVALASKPIRNEEFADARIASPVVITVEKDERETYGRECFGPVVYVVKTGSAEDSLALAKELARTKGALTCGAYTTDEKLKNTIREEMNSVFVPVSFNFTGAGFINSHAAFSDFHLTGGNPAGNASFTNPDFVNKRFVWVGNRYM